MSSQKCRSRGGSTAGSARSSKYDDWICVMCQNHNYSFRLVCNRCHTQTKQHNSYLLQLYQQHLANPPHSPPLVPILAVHPVDDPHSDGHFPSVVLLTVNDEPWEEQPQRWDHNQPQHAQWVSTLIEGE